jgi:hypothetical protein
VGGRWRCWSQHVKTSPYLTFDGGQFAKFHPAIICVDHQALAIREQAHESLSRTIAIECDLVWSDHRGGVVVLRIVRSLSIK